MVPQGAISGSLFVLIYVNDLPSEPCGSPKLFANDTSLFSVVKNVNKTDKKTKYKDLENISNWDHQSKISSNPELNKNGKRSFIIQEKIESYSS